MKKKPLVSMSAVIRCQEYEQVWKQNITAAAIDFMVDEETEKARVEDNSRVTIGGMITGKLIKTTRTGQMMAFITLEGSDWFCGSDRVPEGF